MKSVLLGFIFLLTGCTANERIISVTGNCDIQDSFDRYKLTAMVEYQDQDQSKASANVEKRNNELVSKVKSIGLADLNLNTLSYELKPVREWENNKQVFKGYKAQSSLSIEFSDEKNIGKVLSLLTELNLDQISGPDTFFSKEKNKMLNDKCLVMALKDAKEKAKLMAKTLGASLSRVHRIEEQKSSLVAPGPLYMAKTMRAESAPQIEVGKSHFEKEVFVEFELD